jgi:chloramphenicol-sensitive protein RarD
MPERRSQVAHGTLLGLLAYLMWGAFPLYWPLLHPAGAVEILAHRVVWSLVTMALVISLIGRWGGVQRILVDRRVLGLLAAAAALISVNWGAYIWGVNNGRTVEAALGYFINPLVTMLLGVVVLRERMRPLQWVALGVAVCAVLVIAADYGRPPWLSALLALSFGCYGLLKKQANAPALESLTVESGVTGPVALAYLAVLAATGGSHFTSSGAGHTALFVLSGIVTALPLVCFGAAAIRLPMITLGLIQYLSPTFQLIVGITIQHEHMTPARWLGFAIVWAALVIFTADAVVHSRLRARPG